MAAQRYPLERGGMTRIQVVISPAARAEGRRLFSEIPPETDELMVRLEQNPRAMRQYGDVPITQASARLLLKVVSPRHVGRQHRPHAGLTAARPREGRTTRRRSAANRSSTSSKSPPGEPPPPARPQGRRRVSGSGVGRRSW
jgi:hypothetical protein